MSYENISQKIGTILSNILSDKYEAEVTIKFKEERTKNESRRNSRRVSSDNHNTRGRTRKTKG